jgi:hypothetical protein
MDVIDIIKTLQSGTQKSFIIKKIELNRDFFEDKENTQTFIAMNGNEDDIKYGMVSFAIENETYYQLCMLKNQADDSKIYCYHIEDLYDNESDGGDPMASVRPIFSSVDSFFENIEIQ